MKGDINPLFFFWKTSFSFPENGFFFILGKHFPFSFMQFLSRIPFKTQKSIPSGSDNRGTGLLLQAGMIRMTLAGAYSFTTLGLRTLRKIENIVREEMNRA